MTQTVVDVSRLKDYDSKAAIDSLGTTLANIATGYSGGINQIYLVGAGTGVKPKVIASGTAPDASEGIVFGTAGTGNIDFNTSTTTTQMQILRTASAVNYLTVTGSTSTSPIPLVAAGTGAALGIHIQSKSTGTNWIGGSTTANATAQFVTTTSSINQLVVTSGATGNGVQLAAGGASADSTADIAVTPKSTGNVWLGGATTAAASMKLPTVASSVNQFIATSAATGNPAIFSVGGASADANAALLITALGTGTGSVYLGGAGTLTTASLEVAKTASSVNTVKVIPSATGTAPQITVSGAGGDANRDLYVSGIGTGAARLKGGAGAVVAPSGYVGEVLSAAILGTATTATVTITIAAPGVITWTAHGFSTVAPQPVVFTTSSSLPTGITSGTVYYTIPSTITTNTFTIASTVANALAATAITTSGSQAGTQTGTAGAALASTTLQAWTGLALTAGDWDVWAQVAYDAGATTTYTLSKHSLTQNAAALAGFIVVGGCQDDYLATTQTATNGLPSRTLPTCIVNVSATTNIYLVSQATFATSTLGVRGIIAARRRA